MFRKIRRLPCALILSLCVSSLSACGTPTPPPKPENQAVVVTRPLSSTICPAQPILDDTDLASTAAFAAWLNGPRGRAWISDSRAAGWECFTKLGAIGALQSQQMEMKEKPNGTSADEGLQRQ